MENRLHFFYYLNCNKKQDVEIDENIGENGEMKGQPDHAVIFNEEEEMVKKVVEKEVEGGEGVKLRRLSTWQQVSVREGISTVDIFKKLERKYVFDDGEHDSIKSLIHLKAASNPVYLAVEYLDATSDSERSRSDGLNPEDLRWKDPLRKSLAISRYTWLRSNHDRQYLKETCEISQVSSLEIYDQSKSLSRTARSLQQNC